MSDIEKRALELLNEGGDEWYQSYTEANVHTLFGALCEALEQLDAFKRDVSDAVNKVRDIWGHSAWSSGYACHHLDRFRILPESDPVLAGLALAVEDVLGTVIGDADVVALRDALEARGVKLDGGAA